ncbi:MAG: CoA transferase [Halieaceae bacterium]|nr:CoA transferase [Halieaceae bacterium]
MVAAKSTRYKAPIEYETPITPMKSATYIYACRLLSDFDQIPDSSREPTLAANWQQAGLAAISGCNSDNGLTVAADGALQAFKSLCSHDIPIASGGQLLTERALTTGFRAKPAWNPGQSAQLIPTKTEMIVINLPRASDWDNLHALLETNIETTWSALKEACLLSTAETLIERGRLLDLAIAGTEPDRLTHAWHKRTPLGGTRVKNKPLRVIDLSSLWAGPLCGHLLWQAGCEVIKVESQQRPDGARFGHAGFYDLLNQGKLSICLDFKNSSDIDYLCELLASADIVIEASRPRALRQLGIQSEQIVTDNPGISWIAISAYGREEPEANWVGFGDDTAVAAGLSHYHYQATGEWRILGDAIADPLTGLHGAVAALASQKNGGGELIELSLNQTVHFGLTHTPSLPMTQANAFAEPRRATRAAKNLGEDNSRRETLISRR